ncbi:ewing's tumor-associated antigen 1 isoform X2 [Talpa occidentalis]|uniref:ewing's tumor-associated antigen 1 isoform X2 n=1 Tax=Talpa occidentalis TaxID=50954 RepID=UPI0023F80495|nr:ewing's tumor-associated antigen 1 isoform X2 [Talpa occidentalis]
MSRRRKHGDSPGLKSTPRKAAEDCSSVVEPGKRRLRAARGSGLRGAGEGPPVPQPQQEQPPAAATCERYETPERVLKMDLLSSAFSSPNDPDGLNDIFWDQNSPMTKQLGKGRKKQIYITDSDEISHIVNRIAPQEEKPTANSMLGMWIGETAIPCTPSVAKGKSRAKISCTKLKTQNREEELMKLAKQFDKNMEELDVIQEQHRRNHDFIQTISEAKNLNNYEDNVQMQLYEIGPEVDNAILKKKPTKENTKIPVVNDQNSSQKPFDQNAEAAFNAIFDGSTQKCSGQLSQDVSHTSLNTSNTIFGKKSVLKKENIANETLVTEKLANKTPGSLSHQIDTPIIQSCVTSYTKKEEAFNKHIDGFTTSDFEDNWENLLANEPIALRNIKVPELSPVSETSQIADQKGICNFNNKNDKSKSILTDINLDARLRDPKNLQDVSLQTRNSELTCDGKYRLSPNPNDKPTILHSTGNKMKFEKSFNKIIVQDKFQDCTIASNLTKVKEDTHTKFISNVNASKNSTLNTRYSHDQNNKTSVSQSFKATAIKDPFDSATLDNITSVQNPNQNNTSKLGSFFDDWNDPSFANEIIKACHQLENNWEADDVDDDLLYQACDDIEKLTQQQDIKKDSKMSEGILESLNSCKHEARNRFTISKQGSQLVQSQHLNLSSISVQTSSLTNSPQINKSVKTEKREVCGNSPSFLGATTNLTIYPNNSTCQANNLHMSWNNTGVPIKANSSKLVLTRSSSLSSDHMRTEMASNKKNLNIQNLSCQTVTDEAQSDLNRPVGFSKYTFTRMKNSQLLSQFNQNCRTGSISDTKIAQGLEKNKIVNPLCGDAIKQQSSVKLSESSKQPSKEEEEKNRKYSPEEIQKKRQEALVRRMAKTQASSVKGAPT